jgi:hypothetical protein
MAENPPNLRKSESCLSCINGRYEAAEDHLDNVEGVWCEKHSVYTELDDVCDVWSGNTEDENLQIADEPMPFVWWCSWCNRHIDEKDVDEHNKKCKFVATKIKVER